jgi:hypothetical protein
MLVAHNSVAGLFNHVRRKVIGSATGSAVNNLI